MPIKKGKTTTRKRRERHEVLAKLQDDIPSQQYLVQKAEACFIGSKAAHAHLITNASEFTDLIQLAETEMDRAQSLLNRRKNSLIKMEQRKYRLDHPWDRNSKSPENKAKMQLGRLVARGILTVAEAEEKLPHYVALLSGVTPI